MALKSILKLHSIALLMVGTHARWIRSKYAQFLIGLRENVGRLKREYARCYWPSTCFGPNVNTKYRIANTIHMRLLWAAA